MLRSGGERRAIAAVRDAARLRAEYRMEYPSLVRLLGPRHLAAEIFRPQFNRLTMRRAICRMVPGIAVAVYSVGRRDPFCCDQLFQRREPMPVIGLAGVGIARGLRAFDLV